MNAPWWQHGVIYQIYPRSFADHNGDGIGDLNGITGKLDYLAELGVDALWLSPIYPSPDVDFGYDVSDYCAVDPRFGTLDDFDRLLSEAHGRGIRIVLDLVLNHTSDQHPWFIESRSSKDHSKRSWYLWADPKPGSGDPRRRPPNNWGSVFGGPGWEYDEASGQFYFHMFYKQQPDLNWHNPEVRQAILDVFRFWLERGVDGFRLDVFNAYFKHPELLNNPPAFGLRHFDRQRHIHDCNRPEMIPLVEEIRALLDSYPDRYMVGEPFLVTPQQAAEYTRPGRLHAAFNFEFLPLKFAPARFMAAAQRCEHLLGTDAWPAYVLNNHDVSRTATRWKLPWLWSHPENDAHLKVGAALLLTLRGTPFLYYGEEIGQRDIPIKSREQVLDPIGRRYWPFFRGRDGCRGPMQWDDSENAGFAPAGATPWLPVHPDYPARNVAALRAEPDSLWNVYRRLLALRREIPALREGMFQPVTFGTQYLMAYLRQTRDQTVLVALNFHGRKHRLVLGHNLARAKIRLLFSTHRSEPPALLRGHMLQLMPFEVLILEVCET